ncbi:MAG: arylsulfotransferase family protein [Paracoccaceae bacterium]
MDFSKAVFYAGAAVLVVGGSLVVGMAAVKRDMGLYRAVWGTLDNAKTLWEEMPNLRGTEPIHFLVPARHEGSGVTVNAGAKADDLILLSGFLGDDNKARLMKRDGTVLAEWAFKAHTIYDDPSFFRQPPMTDWNAITHGTIITPEGDVVTSFESGGLVRMDRCGKVKWATHEITHHSPNWMADGGIVVSGGRHVEGGDIPWPFEGPYWEDLVFKFDKDGNKTFEKALTALMIENGMEAWLSSTGEFKTRVNGEFHLNEVEELSPALAPDFPMFQAGDLLLSLRNRNMIVVTDAAVTRIKWWKVGPFVRQHDPDFEKGGKITVFDNHSDETRDGSVAGGSRVWQIDVASGQSSVLYGGREGQFFFSAERSTHQTQPDGNMMITAAQEGRSFEVTPAGKIVWEYVNRWDADRALWLHDAEVYDPSYFTVTDWSCPAP